MAKKTEMHTPRERWVKKVMKILISVYEFSQVPSSSHIRLLNTNPPRVPEGTLHKHCALTLPSTPGKSYGKGGVKRYINDFIKILTAYGFDLDTKVGKKFALIRMEGLVESEDQKEWTILDVLNEITKSVSLTAQVDRESREELRRMADRKGIPLGDLIEEMMEVYQKTQ